jgi:hypothetical protein
MDAHAGLPLQVALVDLDWRDLDGFRAAIEAARVAAGGEPDPPGAARVSLVVAEGPEAPSFRWARLAGVPRAGEVARLSEVVVDAVVVSAASPRAESAARLAAALGSLILSLPPAAGLRAAKAST